MDANAMQQLQEGDTVRFIMDGCRAKVVKITDDRIWLKFEDDEVLGGFNRNHFQQFEKVEASHV